MNKHCWYCSTCYGIFFIPWLSNQDQGFDQGFAGITITEIEKECKACGVSRIFRRMKE